MSSKFGLAGGIPERRVRPIWDAVDSRQFKAALKLCSALLQKYPTFPYALALKALIMERMGKPDEALTICLNAKEQLLASNAVHVDDLTLSTLQIVFQRLDHLDLATSCYEHACEKNPNNLELMIGLFNCYVREYSFVKQQQTAIKMYKILGEERFLLWAVCSIQLQVLCSNGGEKLLLLAEALLKKHINSHGLHEPEALLTYISILEQQAKYSAALEILRGNLGSLIAFEVDMLRLQGRLLARAGDYAEAAVIFQKVITSCPDDWEAFLHYIDCLLEVDICWSNGNAMNQIWSIEDENTGKNSHLVEEVFDSRISSALAFLQTLQVVSDSDFIRCPYLAYIEIENRRRLYGKLHDSRFLEVLFKYFCRYGAKIDELVGLLENFVLRLIIKFHHLACFASDIKIFVHMLSQDERLELVHKFTKSCDSSSEIPTKKLEQVITIFKLQELFSTVFSLPVSELRENAIRMAELYGKNLSLSKELDPQQCLFGEELLTIACNLLVQLFWRTKHVGYLFEALMILEFGLSIRRFTWQYKILLLHIYSFLGAVPLALDWYKTMEIKNILLETVSHHFLPYMLNSPLWMDTTGLINDYLKFMDDYMREAADFTFLAYRHRNYSKVIEFVQFKEQLQHSHQYLMARVEAAILQLKQNANSLDQVEDILGNLGSGIHLVLQCDSESRFLTFNYDMQSRPWWSPTLDTNYLLEPFDADIVPPRGKMCKHYLDDKEAFVWRTAVRRSLIPRLIGLSIQIASSSQKETAESNGSPSDSDSVFELKSLLERYLSIKGYSLDEAVKFIGTMSEGQESLKASGVDMVYWMEFAVFFNAWNLCSRHLGQTVNDVSNSWHVVDNLVKKYVMEQLTAAEPLLTCPSSRLPVLLHLVTEPFSWHILVIQSSLRSTVPCGKKKKKGGMSDNPNIHVSQMIQNSITSLTSAIKDVKSWLQNQIKQTADERLDVFLYKLHGEMHQGGPGQVLRTLENIVPSYSSELGDRILQAAQSWSSVDVARKIILGQSTLLTEFHNICESKLKLLESLKL